MSCDIHAYVEVRREGKWEYIPIESDWQKNWRKRYLEDEDGGIAELDIGRNYDLFAILAGVRNGRGFAGCDTGDGFNPISKPKGLPEDVSPEVARKSEEWGVDGHSHSWHTLADLLAYDLTQRTRLRGWVTGPVCEAWRRYGRDRGESPKSWCGGVSYKTFPEFWSEIIPELLRLGRPEDVRLVLWFDN